ncbi:hypothetical protein A2Y85_02330 [candidate division WOR-3 bacterium RBG_13_43_14]|uniref:HTH cro/C1-type domain-containing protein n=1 Tax=candidate division WOR-3 bacterium RBG_13_43_14 TaxID=1802590 RepID=A0A1F4UF65_UNCW3|nr:MAG: hypothetical protein A2Y85_02330 [candidate division WOR-3 bacterium RBG_13_43_14]
MKDLGKSLSQKRKSLGLTLVEAARLSGIGSYQTIYKIEHEKRAIKADELAALAKAYAFDLNFFLSGKELVEQCQIYWRAEEKPKRARVFESRARLLLERYIRLQELIEHAAAGTKLPIIARQVVSFDDAADEGEKYANMLRLGGRPALVFKRILEEDGNIPIFFLDLPTGTSALSLIMGNYSAICVNRKDTSWRRNFDIAHELFHVVYRQVPPENCGASDNGIQESFANAFASAFLLPRSSLEKEIEKRTTNSKLNVLDLIMIACEYEISLDALVWRLVNLGRISRATAEKILNFKEIKEHYKGLQKIKGERLPYISKKYLCMIFDAFTQGKMSEMSVAEYLDVPVGDTTRIFAEAGLVWEGKSAIEITV